MLNVINTETGEERQMGEEQFKRVKKHGWKKVPATSKSSAKSETAKDSGEKTNADAPDAKIVEILKGNVSDVVAKLKELAEAKDMETINAIGAMELTAETPRVSIANAITKLTEG